MASRKGHGGGFAMNTSILLVTPPETEGMTGECALLLRLSMIRMTHATDYGADLWESGGLLNLQDR